MYRTIREYHKSEASLAAQAACYEIPQDEAAKLLDRVCDGVERQLDKEYADVLAEMNARFDGHGSQTH